MTHPKKGKHIPLDVISGVTTGDYNCTTDDGPSIKAHKQTFPIGKDSKPWCVLLLSIENPFSRKFVAEVLSGADQVPFGWRDPHNRSKYLRFACNWAEEGKIPLFTFGNKVFTLHRGTKISRRFEKDILKISNYILAQMDIVLRSCIKDLALLKTGVGGGVGCVGCSDGSSARGRVGGVFEGGIRGTLGVGMDVGMDESMNAGMDEGVNGGVGADDGGSVSSEENEDTIADSHPHFFPISKPNEEPLDKNDSLVILAGIAASHSSHSDSGPLRPECVNNKIPHFDEQSMRVVTSSFGCDDASGSRTAQTLNEGGLMTMTHLLKSSKGPIYFKYDGYFENGKFNKTKGERPTFVSYNHIHIQPSGSQGMIQHEVKSISKSKQPRLVFSARCTEPHEVSFSTRRMQEVFGHLPSMPKVSSHAHVLTNVWSSITGRGDLVASQNFHANSHVTKAQDTEMGVSGYNQNETDTIDIRNQFEINCHGNADMARQEKIKRCNIVGTPPSLSPLVTATSSPVIREFNRNHISVKVKKKSGHEINAGILLNDWSGTAPRPVLPGEDIGIDRVNMLAHIGGNKHRKQLFNGNHGDCVGIHYLCKNDSTVGEALKNLLSEDPLPLQNFNMRGCGGAAVKVDQHIRIPTSDGTVAATHCVATSQDPNDPFIKEMRDACSEQRCVHVFFKGIYLGLYIVKEIDQMAVTSAEAEAENEKIKLVEKELCSMNKKLFSTLPSDHDDGQVKSMEGVGFWIRLEPVFPQSLIDLRQRCDYRLIRLNENDFQWPKYVPKNNFTGWRYGSVYTPSNPVALLEATAPEYTFLRDSVRKNLMDNGFIDATVESANNVLSNVDNIVCDFKQVLCCAFHAAASTNSRLGGNCVSVTNNGVMSPPRELLGKRFSGAILDQADVVNEYCAKLEESNLKVLINKAPHPPHVLCEPGVPLLADLTKDLSDEEDCFVIFYQALICSIQTPSSLLKFKIDLGYCAPNPTSADQLQSFIDHLESQRWAQRRLLHPTFDKCFNSMSQYVDFIRKLAEVGEAMYQETLRESTDDCGNVDRFKALETLRILILEKCGILFDEFQVGVIMRTIDTRLDYIFGDPSESTVPLGWGSEIAARWLVKFYKKSYPGCDLSDSEIMIKMPGELVKYINDWARPAFNDDSSELNEKQKNQIKLCLVVLGLKWSVEHSRIHHIHGNQRKLDECDTEHMLCMVAVTILNTHSLRNISQTSRIDSAKTHPIRCSGDKLAKEFDLLSPHMQLYEKILDVYLSLRADEDFIFCCLDPVFSIDFEGEDGSTSESETGNDEGISPNAEVCPHNSDLTTIAGEDLFNSHGDGGDFYVNEEDVEQGEAVNSVSGNEAGAQMAKKRCRNLVRDLECTLKNCVPKRARKKMVLFRSSSKNGS